MYLSENVADPPVWIANTNIFVYRKTVPGGFAFVMMDAQTLQKRPAFDAARLAAGLSKATGVTYTALRLPFAGVEFVDDEKTIAFRLEETRRRCELALDVQLCEGALAGWPTPWLWRSSRPHRSGR